MSTQPIQRRMSRPVKVGSVIIGGGFPVAIQSMTNTLTHDVAATVSQARQLFEAGCELVRMAVPNERAAAVLPSIREQLDGPLVADIHFNHKLALAAIEAGFDKIRINPGNIGDAAKIRAVAEAAGMKGVAIRVGVNSGSLPGDLQERFGHDNPEAFAEAALRQAQILEEAGFSDIVLAVKSTDVVITVQAYRRLAERCDYPLHIGITEAGTRETGAIKSAVGLGALLLDGIGDTMRVSLTADPIEEVDVARQILRACALKREGVEVISCPTCARAKIDIVGLARSIEEKTRTIKTPLRVAVMGCVVNGPGEARAADVGIAGGDGKGVLIKKGEVVATLSEDELESALLTEIETMTGECLDR